jgi:hypothetical protein
LHLHNTPLKRGVNAEPEITAIIKGRQRVKAQIGPHRPEVALDFLELQGFQGGTSLPEFEILAGNFLNRQRKLFQTTAVPLRFS